MKYAIIRRYAPHLNKRPELVKFVKTLEAAQAHCNDPTTHGEGWFDGYTDKVSEWDGKPILVIGRTKDVSLTSALNNVYR